MKAKSKHPLFSPLLVGLMGILMSPALAAPNQDAMPSTSSADSALFDEDEALEGLKKEAAFEELLNNMLPMTPDQMVKFKKAFDQFERAKATAPNAPPTPVSSSMVVDLTPGAAPPIVRLSEGFVSSLVFVDSTGSPWPITAFGLGDGAAFGVEWDQVSNSLFIQSKKRYAHGNIAVRLKDLNTPVMLSLVSGQKDMDVRLDLQIAARGPFASAMLDPETVSHAHVNRHLMSLLDGVPPEGSQKLSMPQSYGQAWLKDGMILMRTSLTLLSPSWMATLSSPDGTKVYQLPKTSTILASKEGQTVSIELRGL